LAKHEIILVQIPDFFFVGITWMVSWNNDEHYS